MGQYADLFEAPPKEPSPAPLAVGMSATVSPDAAAQSLKLARRYNMPPAVADQFKDEFVTRAKSEDAQKLFDTKAPRLGSWIAEQPDRAKLVHDDLENFGSIEQGIGTIASYIMGAREKGGLPQFLAKFPQTIAGALGPGIGAGTYGVGASVAGPLEQIGGAVTQALDDMAAAVTGTRKRDINADGISLEKTMLGLQRSSTAVQRSWEGDQTALSQTERDILSGVSSTGQQLPALVAGLLGAPEMATLGFMGLMTAGQSYGKAREAGKTPLDGLSLALPDAAAEILGEKYLGMMGLLKDLKSGMPIAKVFVRDLIRENAGEIPTTLAQNFNEWAVLNPEKSLGDWLDEQPEAIRQTIIATTTQTVLMGGAGAVVRKVADKQYADRWAAQQAEQSAAALERLAQFAVASKTLSRDSETVREFVAEIADEGGDGATELFIDGAQLEEVLNQSGMSREEFAAIAPKAAEQLNAALHGGLVTLPMSEFVVLGEKAAPLIDHIRVGEDMPSRAEAREFMASDEGKALQTKVEDELQRSGVLEAEKELTAGLEQRFKQQLLDAGRPPTVAASEAQTRASAYVTLAQRYGMPLEEFLRDFNLDVVSTELQGDAMTQADTTTPEFRNWFGESKVVDAQGKPLVVYHGTFSDFSKFSDRKLGENTDGNASSESYAQTARVGFWFNDRPMGGNSAGYTLDMPVYLSIQNPKREMSLDWLAQGLESTKGRAYRRRLMSEGYDGIVLEDEEFGGESWIAFRPEQIKSAIGNRGTYDPNDPSILNQGTTESDIIALRKREAVLESLLNCL